MNYVIDTIIGLKPSTIYTFRNPSTPIVVRIETWTGKQRPTIVNDNITEVADTIVFAPIGSDIRFQDKFYYHSRLYEVLHKLPESFLGEIDQFTAIIRD